MLERTTNLRGREREKEITQKRERERREREIEVTRTMIVRQKNLGFIGLLIETRGSIVPATLPHIISSAILGVIACLLIHTGYLHPSASDALKIGFGPFTALGVAISLFLGFHNNASYSRWWEARILWGRQIIVSSTFYSFIQMAVLFLNVLLFLSGDKGYCKIPSSNSPR